MVSLTIGGKPIPFLVDTGATRSVITKPLAQPSSHTITVQGATGQPIKRPFLNPLICHTGGKTITHQFVYMPECPLPLMGRDLLSKLRAQISFEPDGSTSLTYGKVSVEVPQEEAWRLMAVHEIVANSGWEDFNVPSLWAEDNPPGFARHQTPIIVEELPAKHPIRLRQWAYPRHIMQAIQGVIDLYLAHDILVPTESAWNTPILPIPKGDGRFRPVQNLKPVNAATVTIHPLVPNPYVILGLIPQTASWFSVIDLKDAFFTIPVHKKSQHLFAFEWENLATGRKQQYTWTRLPQGYKNSPTLFGNALAADLEALNLPKPEVLLQYVDDLLVTGQTKDICWQNTYDLLHLLQRLGYKASRKKAQLVLQKVRCLGYDIEPGKRTLGHERKEAICRLPTPRTKKELRGFLGAAGFCRIWIPNFSLLAKPLYEATRGSDREPLLWRKEEQKSFSSLKHALMQAPSLGLPDLDKPFQLFVDTKQNVAVGVLTQRLGTWHRPVAYLSKQLDPVARGWPACLKAVAGTALLTQESSKLTFGQELEIQTPHALKAVLETKGHLWLTNPRMLKYQGLITHNPMIVLKQSTSLNPATLLPEPDLDAAHDCIQTIGETYASRPDMSDVPLPRPDYVLYTDGTSFLLDGVRKAGYAVVTLTDIWEAEPLPPGTSAQLAELHALTRALELSQNMDVTIYTDSKYAFLTVQVHGALYKERGLITAGGRDIKYGPQILRLLDSVWAPRKVAVMHCRGHQKSPSDTQLGNHKADQEARHAALRPFNPQVHCLALWDPPESMQPHYSASELAQARELDASQQGGWWVLPDSRVFLPGHMAWDVVNQVHALHLWLPLLVTLRKLSLYEREPKRNPLQVLLRRLIPIARATLLASPCALGGKSHRHCLDFMCWFCPCPCDSCCCSHCIDCVLCIDCALICDIVVIEQVLEGFFYSNSSGQRVYTLTATPTVLTALSQPPLTYSYHWS
ncbi:uncharacterized protein LOC117673685 [Pantherophis guttatus]|uniref:ribonuclease H n=1 Tax=Pantherophis guttatus TaxID=94885 RepID=A0A6P9CV77_PANGU|nr:uncharacterized protein LOC117673685 [Pantherophis guttatus]